MTVMWLMFGLAAALGLASGLLFLRIVVGAFRSRRRDGWLCLLVPGYALYYGFARLAHPRRRVITAAAAGAAVLAMVCVELSTAFVPEPPADTDDAFRDLQGFEGLGSFDDLDDRH